MNFFICKYCGKEWKNNNSLHNHENQCKLNPARFNENYNYAKNKIKSTKECPYCKKLISICNYNKHVRKHETNPEYFINIETRQHISHEGLNCIYCNKLCKNTNSLAQHECRCSQNPNRIKSAGWNKGLTKETDSRLCKLSKSIKKAHEEGKFDSAKGPNPNNSHPHSNETKQRLSEVATERRLGGWSNLKNGYYRGIWFDSGWEIVLAKNLDENKINWIRPKSLIYLDNKGIKRHYLPDFYLPDYDVYLEPKNNYILNRIDDAHGFSDKDKLKWVIEQNNINLILITDEINLNWNYIKNEISKLKLFLIE